MRLADFILQETETILVEWEAFAATLLPAASGMTLLALRDHAKQILEAVAKDLSTPQTRETQSEKSKGRVPKLFGASERAAETHAVLRARGGFDVNQLVAEYRALRATHRNGLERSRVKFVIARFCEIADPFAIARTST